MREKIKGVVKFAAFAICLGLLIHWIDRTVVIKYMYDHSEPQTLTVHIKWLRQKIEANPKKPEHIVTVWGVGYRYER